MELQILKPFACLIIKIFMNGITNFENRLPNVFITLQSIEENDYGKTGHSNIFTFLRHFLIVLKRDFF